MLKDYISVILLAKNERKNLELLLPHLIPQAGELIVMDGHSTDGSLELAREFTPHVFLDSKQGKGGAIREGIHKATKPVIVFIDADHSHNPYDIPKLVVPIFKGDYDHVTGSRALGGSDELHGDLNKFLRMVGSDIILLGINYRFGVSITDCQNGFRAIRTDVVQRLGLEENITTIEQEMIIKTLLQQYRLGEVATHEYVRTFGESKILVRKVAVRYVLSWLSNLVKPRQALNEERQQQDQAWETLRTKIYAENQEEIEAIWHQNPLAFNKSPFFKLHTQAPDVLPSKKPRRSPS